MLVLQVHLYLGLKQIHMIGEYRVQNVPTTANVYAFLTSSSVTPAFNLALTCICTAGLTLAVLTPNPYEYLLNLLSVLVTAWTKSDHCYSP